MSADCLDILTRVLVAQPSERMSMDEIKTHPWFLKGLPPGALEMNDFLLQGLASQEEVNSHPEHTSGSPFDWLSCEHNGTSASCKRVVEARGTSFMQLQTCMSGHDVRGLQNSI